MDTNTNMNMTDNSNDIIWALSPRGKYAHAYPSIKALEAGVPLCGVQCNPTQVLEHLDITDDQIQKITCPDCLARLAYAKFIRPISDLYKERAKEDTVAL